MSIMIFKTEQEAGFVPLRNRHADSLLFQDQGGIKSKHYFSDLSNFTFESSFHSGKYISPLNREDFF